VTDYITPERHVFTVVGKGGRLSDLERTLELAVGEVIPKSWSTTSLTSVCSKVGDEVVFDFYSTLKSVPSEGEGLKSKVNLSEIGALAVLLLKCGYEVMTPDYQEPSVSDDSKITDRPLSRTHLDLFYAGTLVGENGNLDTLRGLLEFSGEGENRVVDIIMSPFPKKYLRLISKRQVGFDLYVKKINPRFPTESKIFRQELGGLATKMLISGYKLSSRMEMEPELWHLPYHDF